VENSPVTIPLRPAGSCCMDKIEPLVYNQYAWTNATSMLYIEQPVGTGFSTGDPPAPANETDVAGDMYAFLQNFLQVFDQYAAGRLYIFGESYAGMYPVCCRKTIYLGRATTTHFEFVFFSHAIIIVSVSNRDVRPGYGAQNLFGNRKVEVGGWR
jgi:hypothetical protein